ncbi:MAG TPA: GNAT family N-acetyltransferase [Jatrophihabitantaceae bacterium]
MHTVQLAHTADLEPALRTGARALLFEVFGDMTDADWEHCLGGMHALVLADGEVVGHAALIQRRLMHGGRALRAGYVEGVAVRASLRRRGVGRSLMAALDRIADAAYDLAALGASDEAVPFYRALGWQQWRGPASTLTPSGLLATPDVAGAIFVRPGAAPLDLDGELTCGWRDGDVW